MRAKGISYDTGFIRNGGISRARLDADVVRRELAVIRDDLHCTAVRIMGGAPERLESAAAYAGELGLEVWFSPYPLELTAEEMLTLFADCAARAERLRRRGVDVVFVAGAELSLMNHGFLPGDSLPERLEPLLNEPDRLRGLAAEASARVNDFLGEAVPLVRERFGGKITYAAIPLERIDWTPFDIVGVDLYRSAEVADQFSDGVRTLVAQGKPVAITEFGAATFHGAGDLGARGLEIVEHDRVTGAPVRLNGEYTRDEAGQATYLRELLEIFDAAGVDSTFVFTFALHDYPHHPDQRDDLDLASYGIVKVVDPGPPVPTWPGNRRPPSTPSPNTTAHERFPAGRRPPGQPARLRRDAARPRRVRARSRRVAVSLRPGDRHEGQPACAGRCRPVRELVERCPVCRGTVRRPGLATVAVRHQATPAQVALAWLLATSPVTLAIPAPARSTTLPRTSPRPSCDRPPMTWPELAQPGRSARTCHAISYYCRRDTEAAAGGGRADPVRSRRPSGNRGR